MANTFGSVNKFKISRRGRKLQATDDQRTLVALPKDVPERTWAEVLQKEENDLFIFEIREVIVEEAMRVGYERYMEKQTTYFTVHCAAQAWLKLIDWHFYRHDPGEDPSAYPPCYIPKRLESWTPDEMPDPSPKDTWCKHDLNVVEEVPDEIIQKHPSSTSLDMPVVEEIPSEYWFPGKVSVPEAMRRRRRIMESAESIASSSYSPSEEELGTESEVLQKVTDYSNEELSAKESALSALKSTSPAQGSLHGAGDSLVDAPRQKTTKRSSQNSKMLSRASFGRSRGTLPPLDAQSRSRISVICDCRLRNLRLDTQYEVSAEKIDTPPGENTKRR